MHSEIVLEVGEALIQQGIMVVETMAKLVELLEDDLQVGIHNTERVLLMSVVVMSHGSDRIQHEGKGSEDGEEGERIGEEPPIPNCQQKGEEERN